MSRPPTLEEAFKIGAEAMRTEIAVRLMQGACGPVGTVCAPVILGMSLPRFQIPEVMEITDQAKE